MSAEEIRTNELENESIQDSCRLSISENLSSKLFILPFFSAILCIVFGIALYLTGKNGVFKLDFVFPRDYTGYFDYRGEILFLIKLHLVLLPSGSGLLVIYAALLIGLRSKLVELNSVRTATLCVQNISICAITAILIYAIKRVTIDRFMISWSIRAGFQNLHKKIGRKACNIPYGLRCSFYPCSAEFDTECEETLITWWTRIYIPSLIMFSILTVVSILATYIVSRKTHRTEVAS